MSIVYLAALLGAILGTGLLDWRHRLAIFGGAPWRTTIIVSVSVGFFLLWDVVGIREGIFFRGDGPWMTGLLLGPELPVEELFFLTLLCYTALLTFLAVVRWLDSRTP